MAKIEAKVIELTPELVATLKTWEAASLQLTAVKADEGDKRKAAFAIVFNDALVGTNRISLGGGYTCKGVRGINYTLEKDHSKVADVDAAIRALNDPEAAELAGKLLKRVYEFSESAYKGLNPENPTHVIVRRMIDGIVTTKDAMPTIEIEAPKEK